jgi:hypothetical protein
MISKRTAGSRSIRRRGSIVLFLLAAGCILAAVVMLAGCRPDKGPDDGPEPGGGHVLPPMYELVVLPPLDGDVYAEARALNNADPVRIVGFSRDADGNRRAVRWTYDGAVTAIELPPLAGYGDAVANDINDQGVSCGSCKHLVLDYDMRPVIWRAMEVKDIYVLGQNIPGQLGEAVSISNNDLIVGWCEVRPAGAGYTIRRPLSFYRGILMAHSTGFSGTSEFRAVERTGGMVVVGYENYPIAPQLRRQAFIMTRVSEKQYLPNPGMVMDAYDVARTGTREYTVVGMETGSGSQDHAFVWSAVPDEELVFSGTVVDLGTLGDMDFSVALGVNGERIVVGGSGDVVVTHIREGMGDAAFIWTEDAGMLDLNDRVIEEEAESYQLRWATDINEKGFITGVCTVNGKAAGFLLVPRVVRRPELAKLGPEEVEQYGTVTYTFEIENPLDEEIDVDLTDPLPAGAEYDPTIPQEHPWTYQDGVFTSSVTVGAESSAEVPLKLKAAGDPGDLIVNEGYSFAYDSGDPIYPAGSVVTLITVPPVIIDMTKTGPAEVYRYRILEYTFTLENESASGAAVTVTDPLPAGAEFDPTIPQDYPWTPDNGVLSTIVGLGPNETVDEINLRLRAVGEAGTVITNAGFAYAVGAGEPVVQTETVQTEILPVDPVDIALDSEDRCIEMEKNQYAVIEPDLEGITETVTRVDYYLGLEILESVTVEPFRLEWWDMPPGIHPVRFIAISNGTPVYESGVTVIVSVVHRANYLYQVPCYEVTELPTPIEFSWVYQTAINDAGDVAGIMECHINQVPVRWIDGEFQVIMEEFSYAFDILSDGTVIGSYYRFDPEPARYVGFSAPVTGPITEIELPDVWCVCMAGRDNGQVAGYYHMNDPAECLDERCERAFIRQDGTFHKLFYPTEGVKYNIRITHLNERGHALGDYSVREGNVFKSYPFIWQAPEDLSELSGEESTVRLLSTRHGYIRSVNNRGKVLNRNGSIYKYDPNDISVPAEYIEPPRGGLWHYMYIDDWGIVVGYFGGIDYESSAALYVCERTINLNYLIPEDTGWNLKEAFCINNAGVIVGNGEYQGDEKVFMLTPVR